MNAAIAALVVAGAIATSANTSPANIAVPAGAASPRPSPTSLLATDLGRMDGDRRAALRGRDILMSGFIGEMLTITDGGTAYRVLRISTSSNGASVVAACVTEDLDDVDRRVRGADVGGSLIVEGYVAGPVDTRAAALTRFAPIVIVACHLTRG